MFRGRPPQQPQRRLYHTTRPVTAIRAPKQQSYWRILINVLFGREHEEDFDLQLERRYLYFALMAMQVRAIRLKQQQQKKQLNQAPEQALAQSSDTNDTDDTAAATLASLSSLLLSLTHDPTLFQQAQTEVEAYWGQLDRKPNGHLRGSVEHVMDPQLVQLLVTWAQVDDQLGLLSPQKRQADNDQQQLQEQPADESEPQQQQWHDILRSEHEYTIQVWNQTKRQQQILLEQPQEEEEQEANEDAPESSTTTTLPAATRQQWSALVASQVAFLETKLGALEQVLDYHGLTYDNQSPATNTQSQSPQQQYALDYFGMPWMTDTDDDHHKNDDDDDPQDHSSSSSSSSSNLHLLRMHQTRNLCRSALIRQALGYSILCLRSTLDSSTNTPVGRGIFVDGTAPVGSLVAFQPGPVWTRELLTDATVAAAAAQQRALQQRQQHQQHHHKRQDQNNDNEEPTAEELQEQESLAALEYLQSPDGASPTTKKGSSITDKTHEYLTSLRFDHYLIDSRQSPVTVLTEPGSCNPWALAHMANHPPAQGWPNTQSILVNYSQSAIQKANQEWKNQQQQQQKQQHQQPGTTHPSQSSLSRYIPNTYVQDPTWKTAFYHSGSPLIMHGMGLLSRRDVCNEELVYDYALPQASSVHDDEDDNENDKTKTNQPSTPRQRYQAHGPLPSWYHPVDYGDPKLDRPGQEQEPEQTSSNASTQPENSKV